MMREFINIVETAQTFGVDLQEYFLSDAYINGVVSSGRWSSHGNYLDAFIDDVCDGDDDDEVVRAALLAWLPHRLKWVADSLRSANESTEIFRSIGVDAAAYEKVINSPEFAIGVFWGDGDFSPQNDLPIILNFTSTLGGVTVDWKATIESRIDYDTGDHEQEFQLVRGTPVVVTDVHTWHVSDYDPVSLWDQMSNTRFTA